MADEDIPDIEVGLRDWLRGQATVTALVASSAIVAGGTVTAADTQVVITRVGGGGDRGDTPLEEAMVQFQVIAPQRSAAVALKNVVRKLLWGIRTATALNAAVVAYRASVQADAWVPIPEGDRPRYVLNVVVTARAV